MAAQSRQLPPATKLQCRRPSLLMSEWFLRLVLHSNGHIYASNVANLVLLLANVYASVESSSLAVIASILDFLSGFTLRSFRMQLIDLHGKTVVWWTSRLHLRMAVGNYNIVAGNCHFCISNDNSRIANIVRIGSRTCHTGNWVNTVMENVWSLIGMTTPTEYLAKLTYLIWNHHKEIKQIERVRAYNFGCQYFVEVDIVLPREMSLNVAHNIGETLQEKP
ncbi:hypothetical protein Q3G72_018097 [Acer saccharum]|nr:hypothetical protein Q3G72_018097 [Acer saccharum]